MSMKIEFHMMPDQPGHRATTKCKCQPKLSRHANGHIIADHRPGRGFKGLWKLKVREMKGGKP